MGLPFWSRGARAREGWANLSREKEEQEQVKKKKKKTENEKEGSWEKEREKAQSTPLVSPVHSWPQVPACSPGQCRVLLTASLNQHTHPGFQGNPSSSQDLE